MSSEAAELKLPRVKPEFEGFLTKRSTWLKDWRSRYFRLIGNKLYFSKDTTVRARETRAKRAPRLHLACALVATCAPHRPSAPPRARSARAPRAPAG